MKLGFIGLGDLGEPMARRLVDCGHKVLVWNRTQAKADTLIEAGASWAESPAQIAEQVDLVGLCLTSHQAVSAVCMGEDGLFAGAARSSRTTYVADFSTGEPEAARALQAAGAEIGVRWVDSPVSGGAPAASRGELIVFAGGEPDDIAALKPLFDALSVRTTRMGPCGSGQMTKLCNNMLVATNVLAIAEMMAVARKTGIDVDVLPSALTGGWADSKPLQIFGPRIAAHAFQPRLGAIGMMAKDVRLARAMASSATADTPLLDQVLAMYASVDGQTGPGRPAADADLGELVGLFEPL